MTLLAALPFVVASLLVGCGANGSQMADQALPTERVQVHVAHVPALDLRDVSAAIVLQRLADSADKDVAFEACDQYLDRTLSIHTTDRRSVAAIVAMLAIRVGATVDLETDRWVFFCPDRPGPGLLFRRDQPPLKRTVAKTPAGQK